MAGADGGRSTIRKLAGIGFPGTGPEITGYQAIAARWTDNARQAETYRHGRVLLAGDAAHVHSPFSGQGLNLGIGDAINLGWKLAATVRGWAPDGLLDSYTAERHPIGAWVLDWTRAQVALMRGDAKTAQLRAVAGSQLLGTAETMTKVVALASGIAQRYAVGDGVTAGVGTDGATTGHPYRVGNLAGDVALTDGSRLADHAHQGTFVLLDRTRDRSPSRRAELWPDRIKIVTDTGDGPAGLLIRPDGVIIWAAEQDSPGALETALRRWAGTPAADRQAPAR